MKAAIYAARLLVCGVILAHAVLARARPPHGPPTRPPEMAAGWRAPPSSPPDAASAPRGNLRGDIENNARWSGNAPRPPSPPRR